MHSWQQYLDDITHGSIGSLARLISLVENEAGGFEELMKMLPFRNVKIIGITGAPGSGKSTLTDALISEMVKDKMKVGVLCIDPSSPFNRGALLGDRIRMSEWYTNPNVFIRSLASKAALGGLHPKIIEISELMKAAWFDYVIIETVGVGQSEIDIAGLADMTTVVMVPESGDIIQTMKAGVMEIADVFLINKSDRPDAEIFYHHVLQMLRPRHGDSNGIVPVIKTVGTERKGIVEWYDFIRKFDTSINNPLKETMALQKVLSLISAQQLKKIDREKLRSEIENGLKNKDLNIYSLAEKFA